MAAQRRETADAPRNVILQGNALDILRGLPDGCVHCVITSPPYLWKRDYGNDPQVWGGLSTCSHEWGEELPPKQIGQKAQSNINGKQNAQAIAEAQQTPMGAYCKYCGAWLGHLGNEPTIALYIDHLLQVFREVGRIMRPDATLWINIGDGYSNDTKWGGESSGKNSHSIQGGYAASGRQHSATGLQPKSLMMIPSRFAVAMQDEGWILRNAIIWDKPNALCESVADRCTMDYEYLFLFAKRPRYYFDAEAIKEPATGGAHSRGKGTHKKTTLPGIGIKANDSFESSCRFLVESRNARSVWYINSAQFPEGHFATFPPELTERALLAGTSPYCCELCGVPWRRIVEKDTRFNGHSARAGRAPEDINASGKWAGHLKGNKHLKSGPVLLTRTTGWEPSCKHHNVGSGHCLAMDPFAGAGTTLMVAKRLGRDYLGVELNPEYIAMAEDRIARDTEQQFRQQLPKAMRKEDLAIIPPSLFPEYD